MTTELLARYIAEVVMTQNIVRKDPEGSGKLMIRKLVTYTKGSSRFAPGEDVDTDLRPDGSVKVDDLETWKPEFEKTLRGSTAGTTRRRRRKLA